MSETEQLTEQEWEAVYAIAQDLAADGTDVNELSKVITYLQAFAKKAQAGEKLFDYLEALIEHGNEIGHSNSTVNFYKSIQRTCEVNLEAYQDSPSQMLRILSWAARLTRYYQIDKRQDRRDRTRRTATQNALERSAAPKAIQRSPKRSK